MLQLFWEKRLRVTTMPMFRQSERNAYGWLPLPIPRVIWDGEPTGRWQNSVRPWNWRRGDNRIALSSGSSYTTQVVSSGSVPVTDPGGETRSCRDDVSHFLPFYPMEKHHDQQNNTTSENKYFNLHVNGIGYLSNIRQVNGPKGQFLTAVINALSGTGW